MGRPLILYGLAPLLNASFEDDADGVDPPTGWGDASVNGQNAVSETYFQSAGSGIPSSKSVRQNVDDGTAGNKAILTQRTAIPNLLEVLVAEGAEIAAVASIRPESQVGLENAFLRLRPYDSTGTSTVGSGSELTLLSSRRFLSAGPEWFLEVSAAKLPSGTSWVDLELQYDIARPGGYSATGSVWWDRVFLGGLVDLNRGFHGRITAELEPGVNANEGDGVFELVRTRRPKTRLDVALENVLNLSDDDAAMRAFVRWLGSGVGKIAVWRSRDDLTNWGRHFQSCKLDRKLRIRNPEGLLRDDYNLRFLALSEGLG